MEVKQMKTDLQEAIENTGLTDSEIARRLRMPVPTVMRWRNGISRPHDLAVQNLLENLNEMTPIVPDGDRIMKP